VEVSPEEPVTPPVRITVPSDISFAVLKNRGTTRLPADVKPWTRCNAAGSLVTPEPAESLTVTWKVAPSSAAVTGAVSKLGVNELPPTFWWPLSHW
jgi:hypothetical protein